MRLPGLARGTWRYVHERSIARHYHQFVAETPLCELDADYVIEHLPRPKDAIRSAADGEATRVLDLGCGDGRISRVLADAGFEVLAIDLSQPMLETLLESCPTSNVLPVRANLVQLECLRPGIADHAVCLFSTLGMIHGKEHRLQCLRGVRRAVRTGGLLVLHVHWVGAAIREPRGVRKLFSDAWRSVISRDHEFGDSFYAYRGLSEMYLHRFTLKELRDALRSTDWRIRQVDWISEDGSRLLDSSSRSSGFFVVAEAVPRV